MKFRLNNYLDFKSERLFHRNATIKNNKKDEQIKISNAVKNRSNTTDSRDLIEIRNEIKTRTDLINREMRVS